MLWPVNPLRGKTTDGRAVCGKSACTVRRGEGSNSIDPSYPYLQPVKRQQFLTVHDGSPFFSRGVLGKYAGGMPVAEYTSRMRFKRDGSSPTVRRQSG